jgi:hypothetical protein
MNRKLERLSPNLLNSQLSKDQQSEITGAQQAECLTCTERMTYVGYPNGDYQRCWDGCRSGCEDMVIW